MHGTPSVTLIAFYPVISRQFQSNYRNLAVLSIRNFFVYHLSALDRVRQRFEEQLKYVKVPLRHFKILYHKTSWSERDCSLLVNDIFNSLRSRLL
ncbi:hypothetical protein Plhal304r1_c058g0144581 [Plasmopara halstedii]